MAARTSIRVEKPKRIRKRKARTEVSSDSSSDSTSSDEQSEAEEKVVRVEKKQKGTKNKQFKVKSHSASTLSTDPSATSSNVPDSPTTINAHTANNQTAEDAFTSFYLRQMTTEFAEDLDKIRSAGDFDNKSISMLVAALQQGRSCFTKDERLSVGRSIAMQEV
ncbi:ribosome-assembly protein 3-domain-containing protein [Delphinella strobiligena]|nr:ribosome-assembly protein 3-domain-containing protein [Delphinella strobiligena]